MIYCCTHTGSIDYKLNTDYTLLNVGREGKNIWNKEQFRHLRHIYFIANNLDQFDYPDTITVFQKRRYLKFWDLPEGYDVTCSVWQWNPASVYNQYVLCHDKKSIDLSKEIISEDEYLMFLGHPMTDISYHNMFTMHTVDFLEYCDFLFNTLFEIEHRLPDWNNACFLGERIGGYYIEKYLPKKQVSQLIQI